MKRNIWFTSDQHFNHENILKFTDRAYNTVSDMNIELIKKWNSCIKNNDIVYVLGDFIWNTTKTSDYIKLMNELNGIKFLIVGNHDKMTHIQAINRGFNACCIEAKIKLAGELITLSHYPYQYTFYKNLINRIKTLLTKFKWYKIKHDKKRPKNLGGWLLHGHSHQKDKVRGKMIHVGVDSWDGYPVNMNSIVEIMRSFDESKN